MFIIQYYRCKIEACEQNNVFESPYNFTTPPNSRGCYKYHLHSEHDCSESSFNTSIVEPCDQWAYQKEDSFVAEVNILHF